MFKRVLLCYDGTAAGRRALRRGAELAILLNSEVHVLSIVQADGPSATVMAGALGHACLFDESLEDRRLLDESLEWLRARGVSANGSLASGDTSDLIVTFAEQLRTDLIVLGHYPRPTGGFWWTSRNRESLADRVRCCIFVAVAEPEESDDARTTTSR
jgi:nucleotide-binding universal stress UspA family protein